MFLNDRKILILEAIINDYIVTGEPIGSRTITKKYNFGLSSATIRNEMSDLEEMGYISQPHASAGRAPTDKGYRLYVDKLMKYRELTGNEIEYLEDIIRSNINKLDYLMEETAKAVSILTNYTSIAAPVKRDKNIIKHLQLLPVDDESIAFVLITNDKIVKNTIIRVKNSVSYDVLLTLSTILNEVLSGKAAEEIDKFTVASILKKASAHGDYSNMLKLVIEEILKMLIAVEAASIYLSGAKNLLDFPEFSDINKAKNLLQTFEEKDLLVTLLNFEEDDSIQIVIGDENDIKEMKNCSIIKSGVKADGKNYGTIGILGPTRMDYAQAASVLNAIARYIEKTIRALTGG